MWAHSRPTCTAGQAGSIIDYAIISTGTARSIKGISVAPGPSAPHLAVFCQVNIDLASMTTQVIVLPRALPPVAEDPPPPIAWNVIVAVHSLNDEDSISKVLDAWHVRIATDASDLARAFSLPGLQKQTYTGPSRPRCQTKEGTSDGEDQQL